MKKIFYIAMLLTLPLFSIAQIQKVQLNTDTRGRSCGGGLGLCSVTALTEVQKISSINKTTSYKLNETTLVFEYNRLVLSENEQISLMGKPLNEIKVSDRINFVQDADFVLDDQLLTNLGFNIKKNTIQKGTYPLVINKETIVIQFTLSEKVN